MKRSFASVAALAALVVLLPANTRAADTSDIVPVRKALAALAAHDKGTVVTQFTSDARILDEFPVYTFANPAAWVDGFVEATKDNYRNVKIALAAPTYNYVQGTSAYVVIPATITAKLAGLQYSEGGGFAATLSKATGSWKITSLAWAKEVEHGIPPIPKMPQAVEDTVRRAIDGINANKMAQTNAQFDPDATFIDEFSQFSWIGTNALDKYNAAFAKTINGLQMTNVRLEPGAIDFNYDDGQRVGEGKNAYIVVPITVTASVQGKPYRETGHQVYGLHKVNGTWKIVFQAWVKESETFNPYH